MCGRYTPRQRSADSRSAGSMMRNGPTWRRGGAATNGAKARGRRQVTILHSLPPSLRMAGSASRRRAKSDGSRLFPKDGTEPTMKRSSSGAAWLRPSRGALQARFAERAERKSSTNRRLLQRDREHLRGIQVGAFPVGPFARLPVSLCGRGYSRANGTTRKRKTHKLGFRVSVPEPRSPRT
jgi:hypothetical protein